MDDFLGLGGLFDLDGDGSLDAGETAFGLMMMDDVLTDEDAEDPDDLFAEEEDSELELMTGYSRDDLELMDADERAEVLGDAGYEPDDFGFDDF
jgi:hypothetical protein